MSPAAVPHVTHPGDLSHMPFLFRHRNELVLVFAWSRLTPRRVPHYSRSGTTRVWSLRWRTYDPQTGKLGPLHHVPTGRGANEVSCSVCVSEGHGELHLSFIGTSHHGTGDLEHHLFRMSGPNLNQLGRAVRVAPGFCGFWRPDLTAVGTGEDGRFHLAGSLQGHYVTSFAEIARLSFDPDHPWHLLITGNLPHESQPRTVVYDAQRGVVLGELQTAGSPVYKPALCDGVLVHPQSIDSPLREAWQLTFTSQFGVVPTAVTISPV